LFFDEEGEQMTTKIPPPPTGLLTESRAYWREIHKELTFSAAEAGIVRTLVRNYDLALRCLGDIQRDGTTVDSGSGARKKNPSLDLYRVAVSAYLQACRLLGLKEDFPSTTSKR
jgi:phage terminase small subunit